MTVVKSSQGEAEWEEGVGRGCYFIRSGQGRPLSTFPFELRSSGGKRMCHTRKEHFSQWDSKYKGPKAKHVDLFEEGPRCRGKQVVETLDKEFGFHFKSSGCLVSTSTLDV